MTAKNCESFLHKLAKCLELEARLARFYMSDFTRPTLGVLQSQIPRLSRRCSQYVHLPRAIFQTPNSSEREITTFVTSQSNMYDRQCSESRRM